MTSSCAHLDDRRPQDRTSQSRQRRTIEIQSLKLHATAICSPSTANLWIDKMTANQLAAGVEATKYGNLTY